MILCKKCGSLEVQQEIESWMNPNYPDSAEIVDNAVSKDSYWCNTCDKECETIVVTNDEDTT